MKPLPEGHLTIEDCDVWVCVGLWKEFSNSFRLEDISKECDRRDAALMLEAQHIAEWGPAAIELHGIACRGWNDRGYWIEDTEDGEGIWQRD